jgi:hypothetical protein
VARPLEWTLHLTTDPHCNPEFAWISVENDVQQALWVADQDFGPFDTLTEVHRWLVKAMFAHRRVLTP